MKFAKKVLPYLFLFIVAAITVYFFSYGNGILSYNSDYVFADDGIFRHVGMEWLHGYVPYTEVFDHKGPFIFLINAIAYIINPSFGIGVLEILFLFITLIFAYRLLLSHKINSLTSIILTILSGFFFAAFAWNFGNTCSEFVLPFLMACFYLIDKYEMLEKAEHSPKYALFYGITFGVCLMSRGSDALVLCSAVLCIAVYLVFHKKIKNLVLNALLFVLGTLIFILPFAIYFYEKGSFYDFLNGTLLFNFEYMDMQSNAAKLSNYWIHTLKTAFSIFAPLFFVALVELVRKKRWMYFCTLLIPFIFLAKTGYYQQYYLVIFPLFIIGIAKGSELFSKILKTMFLFALIICIFINATKYYQYTNFYQVEEPSDKIREELAYLQKQTNGDAYYFNIPAGAIWDIDIPQKYFNMQIWHGRSPHIASEIANEFSTLNPEYILMFESQLYGKASNLEYLLPGIQSNYELIGHTEHLQLYQNLKREPFSH